MKQEKTFVRVSILEAAPVTVMEGGIAARHGEDGKILEILCAAEDLELVTFLIQQNKGRRHGA